VIFDVDVVVDFFLRVDDLIGRQATGTPAELAQTLDIGERSVYRLIGKLKRRNLPIAYCRLRRSYYYTTPGKLSITFEPLDTD